MYFLSYARGKFHSMKRNTKHMGIIFSKKCIAFAASHILPRDFNIRENVWCAKTVQPLLGKSRVLISNLMTMIY